jgi:hypothetical protein
VPYKGIVRCSARVARPDFGLFSRRESQPVRANPAKVEDFGDKDLLQHIDLARILIGEAIPLRRDAR